MARRFGWLRPALLAFTVVVIAAAVTTSVVRSADAPPTGETAPRRPAAVDKPTPTMAPRADDVRWDDTLAVRLPVSAAHGPLRLDPERAAGFDRTDAGAAFAAVHLVARTSPSVGPAVFAPTLAEQVRGPNRLAMEETVSAQYETLRRQTDVPNGQPLPGADAEVVGYRIESFDEEVEYATVQVVLTSADLRATDRVLVVLVSLQWADDDWQVVAPPQGDWATVSRIVTSPPTGMLEFDQPD